MEETYRVGTRNSPLALKQVDEVLETLRKFYPDLKAEVTGMDTYGDVDKATPISEVEGTDFFTREIDEALLKGGIDFAVHSAKDLPDTLREGLVIAALTAPINRRDALVSRSGLKLEGLPNGARIATSSARRKARLKAYRMDFDIVDIRGNIEERLKILDGGSMDAIVIAACGLIRLGLENRIAQMIPLEIIQPHPLQGALAITAPSDRGELIEYLSVLDAPRKG